MHGTAPQLTLISIGTAQRPILTAISETFIVEHAELLERLGHQLGAEKLSPRFVFGVTTAEPNGESEGSDFCK